MSALEIPVDAKGMERVWGKYPNYDDIARFEYGRMMWKLPDMRARMLKHWLAPEHPYHERFAEQRALIEEVLTSTLSEVDLDEVLRQRGKSLRVMAREIPPIFGSFF